MRSVKYQNHSQLYLFMTVVCGLGAYIGRYSSHTSRGNMCTRRGMIKRVRDGDQEEMRRQIFELETQTKDTHRHQIEMITHAAARRFDSMGEAFMLICRVEVEAMDRENGSYRGFQLFETTFTAGPDSPGDAKCVGTFTHDRGDTAVSRSLTRLRTTLSRSLRDSVVSACLESMRSTRSLGQTTRGKGGMCYHTFFFLTPRDRTKES